VIVLDSSALLAMFSDEPGGDEVRVAMSLDHVICPAPNWSECAQKMLAKGRDWASAASWVRQMGLSVEPVTAVDAEWAAEFWLTHRHLSLADRLCLALAHRLGVDAWTADAAWGDGPGIHQIR